MIFFGCEAFVQIPKENRTKLNDKSMKCIFLGYENGELGYHLWDPVKKKFIISKGMSYLMSHRCLSAL